MSAEEEIEVVQCFTTSPIMVYSFPSTRLYIDLPIMSNFDPTLYLDQKYDCYAYIGGQKYEVKECIRVGISYMRGFFLSSIISEHYVIPMGNLILPDCNMQDFETNNEVGVAKTINSIMLQYTNEVYNILGTHLTDIELTPSTINECYQLHLSFNYTDVLNYVNSKYSTNYTSGVEIKCYILKVINYFFGILISAGSKSN